MMSCSSGEHIRTRKERFEQNIFISYNEHVIVFDRDEILEGALFAVDKHLISDEVTYPIHYMINIDSLYQDSIQRTKAFLIKERTFDQLSKGNVYVHRHGSNKRIKKLQVDKIKSKKAGNGWELVFTDKRKGTEIYRVYTYFDGSVAF